MMNDAELVLTEAIDWHVRSREMGTECWHELVRWLEILPAHAAAFDRVTIDDAVIAPLLPANDSGAASNRGPRGVYRWGAVAATLAVILSGATMFWQHRPAATSDRYVIATSAGERRNVMLADGSRIEVSGGTRITLDRTNQRVAALESGEAVFHVRHGGTQPFTLRLGEYTLQDVGTVFDVSRTGTRLEVAVAEGGVIFDPATSAIVLTPRKRLSVDLTNARVVIDTLPSDQVGEWRHGRLTFTDEPLANVVERLGRVSGVQLSLSPELSSRRFTGMVRLTGVATRDIPHFAELTGTSWTHDGGNWVIVAGTNR